VTYWHLRHFPGSEKGKRFSIVSSLVLVMVMATQCAVLFVDGEKHNNML
jgi:hypothetical protein